MELESGKSKNNKDKSQKALMDYFREYCGYTGIHGFIYIGEDRTTLEKIWWILSLLFSIMLCAMMIFEIFLKYVNYPVLVTFSMKETHLQEIPFPALTICSRAKFAQKVFNVTEIILKNNTNKISKEELTKLDIASTVCEFYASGKDEIKAEEDDFFEFLKETKLNILDFCYYLGKEMNCSDIFTPIFTEEGICYSFNILDKQNIFNDIVRIRYPEFHNTTQSSDWNLEQGYTKAKVDVYPRRALRIGTKHALIVVLKLNKSEVEYECGEDDSGYRVSLHLPSNIPEVPEHHFYLPLDSRVNVAISPRVIKTSKAVKRVDVTKRDCYFESERKLKFFKYYTQENCRIECRSNYTLAYCGCVGFHMPSTPGTPICLLKKIECLVEAEFKFATYNEKLSIMEDDEKNYNGMSRCDCRPSCSDISYEMELSHIGLISKTVNKLFAETYDKDFHYSALVIFFKKNQLETKERNELYGFSDVISNFGGILGLFTGFSVLSFIEIIYYLSLRLWGNLKLYGNWWGPKNNVHC